MSDFGTYNNNLKILLTTLQSAEATSEEKEKALSEVTNIQNIADLEYLNELDVNKDKYITQKEYEKSKEYIEYLHLSSQLSLARKAIEASNSSTQTPTATESFDLDENNYVSTLEYESQQYSKTHTSQSDGSLITNYLNYILGFQSEKKLTNPDNLVNEINVRVNNFMTELNSGKYSTEEIQKYFANLNNVLGRVKSQILTSYDRQYIANNIPNERTANRDNKNKFQSGMDKLILPYKNLLNELKSTYTDAVQENSYSIAVNINKIKTVANGDNLYDVDFTIKRIKNYIQEIESREQSSAFLGTDRNKYLSKETAELIKIALSKSKESVLAKLNQQYEAEVSADKKAEIQSRIADFTTTYDNLISEYQTFADNATSRERVFTIPENIRPLFSEVSQADTTQKKRDKLKDIISIIDDMINDITAKYVTLGGDDNADARYELRSELKNLYDLKEVCNIPDDISDEILETTSGQATIIQTLSEYYSKFGSFKTEAGISQLKTNIRTLLEQADVYQKQQNKVDSYLELLKNATTEGYRSKIRQNIDDSIADYSDVRKIIVYNKEINYLKELITTLDSDTNSDTITQINNEIQEITEKVNKLMG